MCLGTKLCALEIAELLGYPEAAIVVSHGGPDLPYGEKPSLKVTLHWIYIYLKTIQELKGHELQKYLALAFSMQAVSAYIREDGNLAPHIKRAIGPVICEFMPLPLPCTDIIQFSFLRDTFGFSTTNMPDSLNITNVKHTKVIVSTIWDAVQRWKVLSHEQPDYCLGFEIQQAENYYWNPRCLDGASAEGITAVYRWHEEEASLYKMIADCGKRRCFHSSHQFGQLLFELRLAIRDFRRYE